MDLNKIIQRARALLVTPRTEWPVIAVEPTTVQALYRDYIVVLAAIPPVAQFVKLCILGTAWHGFRIYRLGIGPGLAAAKRKIVGVSDLPMSGFFRIEHLVRDALALAIGHSFFPRLEAQRELLLHVARTGPAHQRLHETRLLRLVVELPILRLGPAGLHRVFDGLKNTGGH